MIPELFNFMDKNCTLAAYISHPGSLVACSSSAVSMRICVSLVEKKRLGMKVTMDIISASQSSTSGIIYWNSALRLQESSSYLHLGNHVLELCSSSIGIIKLPTPHSMSHDCELGKTEDSKFYKKV